MSKSLGNFFTLRDLLAKGFGGREIRYLLMSSHYRETFNFTIDGLTGARSALARIDECVGKLRELAGTSVSAPAGKSSPRNASSETGAPNDLIARFTAAMDEDLNVAGAWGAVFEWVKETNRKLSAGSVTPAQAVVSLNEWDSVNSVLGIRQPIRGHLNVTLADVTLKSTATVDNVSPELLALLEERQAARKARDFKRADAIRDELKAKGWVIEDTAKGPRLKKL